jgi:uncharacterized protein YbgA (DUF1722 family)
MLPHSPAFPHEPDVKVQNSRGMCECSNGMTLHRYAMLVDLIVEGFAEDDGVSGTILGSGSFTVVRSKPEVNAIKKMKTRGINQRIGIGMILGAEEDGRCVPRAELRDRYEADFMGALRQMTTTKRHANVLQHIIGYLSKQLDSRSRQELHAIVNDYRSGIVQLIVPITLVRHYVRKYDEKYLQGQIYLDPHPKELMLRNHV